MIHSMWHGIVTMLVVGALGPRGGAAQDFVQANRGPRFLLASIGADSKPMEVDAARVASLRQRVSLDLEGVRLSDALDAIARQAHIRFVYVRNLVPADSIISFRSERITVAAALTELLLDAGVDLLVSGSNQIALVRSVGKPVPVGTITGRVTDGKTGQSLQGADVLLEGTPLRTTTGADGRYRLAEVQAGTYTVTARQIGFGKQSKPVTVANGAEATVNFALEQAAVNLDEMVVTGTPQQQAMRSLGNALGKVRVSQVEEIAPAPNVQNLLSTGVPGVRVMSAGGDVGSGGNIRVRGAGSMALSSEPLLYVDGVRVNNNGADGGGIGGSVGVDNRYAPSRINDLNPEDIESIEVIKGPAAATLYGTEASNGVINIITKKGQTGAPVFTITAKHGANWIPDPENFFPPTYYKSASGEIKEFRVLRSDRVTGEYPGDTISYGPWFRTGQPQGYAAAVSGGTQALAYYFSGDWDRDEGAVDYNWKNRFSGRANLNFRPNDKFSVDFGLGYLRSKYRSASAIQPVTVRIIWACPTPGCEPGRNLPNGIDGPFRGYLTGPPETYEQDAEGYEDLDRGTVNATVRHRPWSWFSHRLTFGGDFTNQELSELLRRSTLIGASSPNGAKTVENTRTTYVSADYAATATFHPGKSLGLESSAGVQFYRKQQGATVSQGTIFPVRQLETVSAGSVKTGQETFFENKTFGAYFQQQISWKNRIFLTGAVRGDDNSAFGKNFDFVVYPKLSASWVLSEEPFFSKIPFVSSLKLRGAWGKAGQQPDVFAAVRTYVPEVGDGGLPTLTPENVGNPDLEPEVGTEWETGLDLSLFNERVGIEFTYYKKQTRNAIAQVPVQPSTGFPGVQYLNIGEVQNQGFELGLNTTLYRARNLGIDLNLKYSHNTNEVVDLGSTPFLVLSSTFGQYHVPGFPLGGIFQRRVVSADLDTSGPQNVATNMMCESGPVVPGTNFSKGGGPPVPCLQAPAVYWGSELPTWEGTGALTITLYQNLQLFGQVDFVGGNTILSGDVRAAHMSFRNSRAILERTDPILLAYDVLDTRRQPGIMKDGFAKLRDVSLSYNLPRRWAQHFGANRASLTISAMNLWTIWVAQKSDFGHQLVDPEIRNNGGGGADPGGLTGYNQEGWPQLRRFLVTLRASF